jgi:2-polyprenyl-3-methyl-5-hydroxy-6-metoxy-1,4-benzoquinol methylase
MGVAEGHGFDPYADRLQVLQRVIAEHGLTNLYAAQVGLEEADYPHGAFDMILSNEAISHYPSVERFLERAAQWLRKGGVLIIADGNNGANPQVGAQNAPNLGAVRKRTCGQVRGAHYPAAVSRTTRSDYSRVRPPTWTRKPSPSWRGAPAG